MSVIPSEKSTDVHISTFPILLEFKIIHGQSSIPIRYSSSNNLGTPMGSPSCDSKSLVTVGNSNLPSTISIFKKCASGSKGKSEEEEVQNAYEWLYKLSKGLSWRWGHPWWCVQLVFVKITSFVYLLVSLIFLFLPNCPQKTSKGAKLTRPSHLRASLRKAARTTSLTVLTGLLNIKLQVAAGWEAKLAGTQLASEKGHLSRSPCMELGLRKLLVI